MFPLLGIIPVLGGFFFLCCLVDLLTYIFKVGAGMIDSHIHSPRAYVVEEPDVDHGLLDQPSHIVVVF